MYMGEKGTISKEKIKKEREKDAPGGFSIAPHIRDQKGTAS
jgi:hypothetical protein